MIEENDWRLQGQENYLTGLTFELKKYKKYSPNWDHDHCEFCWKEFSEEKSEDVLNEGYATEDNYRWICPACFLDFKEMFDWKVKEELK